jgi:hypothetical protein
LDTAELHATPTAALARLYELNRVGPRTADVIAVENAFAGRMREAKTFVALPWRYAWSHGDQWFVRLRADGGFKRAGTKENVRPSRAVQDGRVRYGGVNGKRYGGK